MIDSLSQSREKVNAQDYEIEEEIGKEEAGIEKELMTVEVQKEESRERTRERGLELGLRR